jgi:hypothetical protein
MGAKDAAIRGVGRMRAAVAQWRKNLDLARWVMRENKTLPAEIKLHILSCFEREHFICTGCRTKELD